MQLSEEQVAQEAEWIREKSWPLFPVLPVKNLRRHEPDTAEGEDLGLVIYPDLTKVWLMNLVDLKTGLIAPQLEGRRCLEFGTVEDMVRAGWVGD